MGDTEGGPIGALRQVRTGIRSHWPLFSKNLALIFLTSQVEDAFVAFDRESGRSRGFGFVTLQVTICCSQTVIVPSLTNHLIPMSTGGHRRH